MKRCETSDNGLRSKAAPREGGRGCGRELRSNLAEDVKREDERNIGDDMEECLLLWRSQRQKACTCGMYHKTVTTYCVGSGDELYRI